MQIMRITVELKDTFIFGMVRHMNELAKKPELIGTPIDALAIMMISEATGNSSEAPPIPHAPKIISDETRLYNEEGKQTGGPLLVKEQMEFPFVVVKDYEEGKSHKLIPKPYAGEVGQIVGPGVQTDSGESKWVPVLLEGEDRPMFFDINDLEIGSGERDGEATDEPRTETKGPELVGEEQDGA